MSINSEFVAKLIEAGVVSASGAWHKGSAKRLEASPMLSEVMDKTRFLDGTFSLKERVLAIKYGLRDKPSCLNCGKHIPFLVTRGTLQRYCCSKCSNSHGAKKDTTRDSLMAKYGVTHNSQLDSVKKSKIASARAVYGVDNVFQSEVIKKKARKTALKNYGVEMPSKAKVVREKIEATNREKFGADYRHLAHIKRDGLDKSNDREWMASQIAEGKRPYEIADMLGMSEISITQKLNALGVDWSKCVRVSKDETALLEFIKKHYKGPIETGYRKLIPPYHVDIYLPKLGLAIEYNGNYWHAEQQKRGGNYHIAKTRACQEKGVKLIHIFEHEWLFKGSIVRSRIQNALQRCEVVFARDCDVVELSSEQAREFFTDTHLQGFCSGSRYLGLALDDELVCAMSFGKPRFSKKYSYELLRYSTQRSRNVVGGASRLLKGFVKTTPDAKTIVSYKCLKWGVSDYYEKLGFKHLQDSRPSYDYVHQSDYLKVFNRIDFQKHKLADKLDVFDPNLSEYENMQANGYDRLWNCGSAVYLYEC